MKNIDAINRIEALQTTSMSDFKSLLCCLKDAGEKVYMEEYEGAWVDEDDGDDTSPKFKGVFREYSGIITSIAESYFEITDVVNLGEDDSDTSVRIWYHSLILQRMFACPFGGLHLTSFRIN